MSGDNLTHPPLRRAEVVAALSLATDLGSGQPLNHALRVCALATHFGADLGLDTAALRTVYYVALLRSSGCVVDSDAVAARFGNEITANAVISLIDPADMRDMLRLMLRHVGEGKPLAQRIGMAAAALAAGPGERTTVIAAHCEVAEMLAERMGFGVDVTAALGQVYERWDGKGWPHRLKGEAITPAARIVALVRDADLFYNVGGLDAVNAAIGQRAGALYDPDLSGRFLQRAGSIFSLINSSSPWEATLACEPGDHTSLSDEELDESMRAIADVVDIKSHFTVRHSSGVAALAESAGRVLGLPEPALATLRRAALLHDLGRVAISVAIWEKPGALNDGEWEQVRLHPYYTERVLARAPALATLGALAAQHHERIDGSGYFRQSSGSLLSLSARALAAADVYHAMIEPRPHRPALQPEQAAEELHREARARRLDNDAVNAVLTAAGHTSKATRQAGPGGLSEREIEVLGLIARGATYRETASALVISERTVEHHVRHIYDKLGVSTRAGATYFAMRHNLLGDDGDPLPSDQ